MPGNVGMVGLSQREGVMPSTTLSATTPLRAILLALLVILVGCATPSPHELHAISLEDGDEVEILSAGSRYFTFTLDAPASVVLESHTHPGQLEMIAPSARLLDAEGNQLARDWQSGRERNFRLEERLEPGVWFVHVMNPFACQGVRRCSDLDYRYRVSFEIVPE